MRNYDETETYNMRIWHDDVANNYEFRFRYYHDGTYTHQTYAWFYDSERNVVMLFEPLEE